jgi:hypothetical protein
MLASLLLLAAAQAGALLGVAWVPFSRGDALWVLDDHDSGTAVGELDGWLEPALTFHGGIQQRRWALLGSLGVARLTTTTWLADGRDQVHVGALRLGAGYRRYFGVPSERPVQALAELGLYGVIPSARQLSDSWTEEEQNDADEDAAYTRKTIGGLGGWIGPGFGWWVHPQVMLGARYHIVLHRGQVLTEDTLSVSTALYGQAALLLEAKL